jgi:hypothetical protein
MRRALAVLLLSLAVAACSGEADFSDSMPAPVILSAEKYQPQIEALDRLAFTAGDVDDARRKAMGDAFEELAGKVREGSDSKFLLLESLELRALAGHARRAEAGRGMQAVQENWMRIRNNLFDDRAWFARSAADLAPVPAATESAAAATQTEAPVTATHAPLVLHANPLHGRWALRELYGNGKRMTDAELSGAVWTFDEGLLSMESAGGSSHYSYSEVHDERGNALRVRESDTPSNRPAADGWMIYDVDGSRIKIAFFDGLGERPDGFERTDGKTEPMLTLAVLERVP